MSLHRYLLPALVASSLLMSTAALADTLNNPSGGPFGRRDDGRDIDGRLPEGDAVDGFLSTGEGRFVLDYAYAISEPSFNRALRADEQAPGISRAAKSRFVVFLTDKVIPPEARGDIGKIEELVNRGELHGLELSFDSVQEHPRWAGRLLLGDDGLNQVFRDRHGGRNVQIRDFERVGRRVSGTIFIRRDIPRRDFDGDRIGKSAGFAVEFNVAVNEAPAPTNTFDGRIAWKTPQADALVLAMAALRDRDVERFKQLAATNSEVAARIEGPDADRFRRDLLSHLPPNPQELRQSIKKIVIFGDRAFLLTKTGSGGGREFILLREAGGWKLAQG
jgi:hypothetical protein